MRSFLTTLVAGLAFVSQVANALPQPVNDATAVQEIERRAPPKAADEIKTVAGHTGLYVPMMYAGYVDGKTGKWERYQCDDGKGKEIKKTGTLKPEQKQAVTDGLASCVSISVIAKDAALKTHVPPYLCPIIKGDKKDKELEQQLKNLKTAVKAILKDHKKELEKPTTVAVSGPYGKQDEVRTILNKLFDNDAPTIMYKLDIQIDPNNDHRTTEVDLTVSPPKFYIEGREHPY